MVDVLGLMEVYQVLVICEDLDREGGTMEIMSPGFQGVDDGKELSVIDVIIAFCWDERLGEVGAGVPIAIGVGLEEDGQRIVRVVRVEVRMAGEGIGSSKEVAWDVNDLEVKVSKVK